MNIDDYLINQEGLDWPSLLEDWKWLLPESYTIWLVNRLGDIVVVNEDGSVNFMEIADGSFEKIAESRDDFIKQVDRTEYANGCFAIPLVDQLVESGLRLSEKTVYSFKVPPALGGRRLPENFQVTDISVHYSVFGQLLRQVKNLPPGTKVGQIKVVDVPKQSGPSQGLFGRIQNVFRRKND